MEEFKAEAKTMAQILPHPNVIVFRGITLPPDPLCIVMEYCKEDSLHSYLRSDAIISNDDKIRFAKHIARGMLHLHTGKKGIEIIHRDVATRNILLKEGMIAAVSDFGMARIKQEETDSSKTTQVVGPLKWMAPESVADQVYSIKSDSFSYGVVLYEIVSRKDPWYKFNNVVAVSKVLAGERMQIEAEFNCSPILEKIMKLCWKADPADRPDFSQILDMLDEEKKRRLSK